VSHDFSLFQSGPFGNLHGIWPTWARLEILNMLWKTSKVKRPLEKFDYRKFHGNSIDCVKECLLLFENDIQHGILAEQWSSKHPNERAQKRTPGKP
jgi:hypothetical protein